MAKKICFIVSSPSTAKAFLKDHIKKLAQSYEIYLVANLKEHPEFNIDDLKEIKHIEIVRSIKISKDLKAIYNLWRYFRNHKFDAVHSVTPKAGLITAVASKLASVKSRIHIFTGQVWASRKGFSRKLLKLIDKLIVLLNNQILVDGEAQRQFLIENNVLKESNSKVLGEGSICGVNTDRFIPSEHVREGQRQLLNVGKEKIVIAFMGRLNRDKGIFELLAAFNKLAGQYSNVQLTLFGADEEDCLKNIDCYNNISKDNFNYVGPVSSPEKSLQVADIFVLPSYREGFGMSVIEASCLGLPVICSDAYGLKDTMVDNITGLRCHVGDVQSLYKVMEKLYLDENLRKQLGDAGRKRVLEKFSTNKVVDCWNAFYHEILDA